MKILIICSNLIGDTILSTGVFNNLANKYQNAKFTFVIGPTAKPILKNYNNIEKIITINKQKYNFHWLEVLRKTSNSKWDIVIDLRSSLLSFFLQKNKKYVFSKTKNIHHVDQLSKSFGFDCSSLNIKTSEQEDHEVKKVLSKNNKYIVIFPGGNWKPKLWSIENYNKLMKLIHSNNQNIKFIIVGSEFEKKHCFNKLTSGINKEYIIDLFGFNLTLTSAYMKKCNLFIGNDSGLMHLSVASNLQTIALFGPTNDKVYGPYGNNNIVLRTDESYEHFQSIKINPNISYMNSILPSKVSKIIEEIKFYD